MADQHPLFQPLRDSRDFERALTVSHELPYLVFKHSLTCSISTWALAEVRAALENEGPSVASGLLEIQNARPLSQEVAERTGIRHESPQAVLFVDGVARWNSSHWDLSRDAVSRVLGEHLPVATD